MTEREDSGRKAQALFDQMVTIAQESGMPVQYDVERPMSPFEKHGIKEGQPLPVAVELGAWRPLKRGEAVDPLYINDINGQPFVPAKLFGPGK